MIGAVNMAKSALNASKGTLLTVGGLGFATDAVANTYMGDDLGTALTKASVTGVLAASNPALFGGLMLGSVANDAYWGVQSFNHKKRQWWNSQYATDNRVGGGYADTQRAQTMRQAAVTAIQGSKLNARSALGGEAKIMNPYSTRRY